VYGTDGRTDYYASTDATWRQIVQSSTVALIDRSGVSVRDPNNVQVSGSTLVEQGICSTERFADQLSAASCSGVLIDDDLVLTAGHCAENLTMCRSYSYVFRFYMEAEGRVATITSEDVFTCAELVTQRSTDDRDYAVIRLDRAATPRHQHVTVQRTAEALATGQSLILIGFPSGLPAKIDTGGKVVNARRSTLDYFIATVDSFSGNSGSSIFDAQGRVVGTLTSGQEDYIDRGSCAVVNRLADDGSQGGETAMYAFRAIQALCAVRPSSRACTGGVDGGVDGGADGGTTGRTDGGADGGSAGRTDGGADGGANPICGDGRCDTGETYANCPDDCQPVCGDGRCEGDESPETCEQDCGRAVPSAWTCDPSFYGDGLVCDCACGARDPDCDEPSNQVLGCAEGQTCNPDGVCASPTDAGDSSKNSSSRSGCHVVDPSTSLAWLGLGLLPWVRRRRQRRPELEQEAFQPLVQPRPQERLQVPPGGV
jgi:V8-like Glu-specific endopeptidase